MLFERLGTLNFIMDASASPILTLLRTLQVFAYMLKLYGGRPFITPGKRDCIFGFDDGCHLLRFAKKRAGVHSRVDEFLRDVTVVGASQTII